MIKIKNTDSLIDIISKIKNSKDFSIILDFPFGHPILYNYLSLKIIKNKCGSKNLIIITHDLSSKKIGKSLGIKYSLIKDEKFIEKENLLKHNFTFFEYFKYEINKYIRRIKKFIFKNKKTDETKNNKDGQGGLSFFLVGLLLSIIMLLFVFYFAVNKSYIYITPEITVKTRGKNIVFEEKKEDSIEDTINNQNNSIILEKISKNIHIEETFQTSGIKEDSIKKSSGEVIIFNKTSENQELVGKTRLQTENGILYEIDNPVDIPSATRNEKGELIPGQIKTRINAKVYDINGVFIGNKGNIGSGVNLLIPGLEKEIQSQVYAITSTDITGGGNQKSKFLSKEDLMSSEKILDSKLKDTALKELKKELKDRNNRNNITYDFLDIKDSIKYSKAEINRIGNLNVGDKIENFRLSGNIKIEGYIYNRDDLISKMKGVLNESILSDIEKVSSINEKSLRISNLIYVLDQPYFQVKATVELDVFILHVFSENGDDYYLERLKNSILGLSKDEAEKVLLNDKQIGNVVIDIKPFFIKNLPKYPNNIIFKVDDM